MEIKWKSSKVQDNLIAQTIVFPKKYWPQTVLGGSEASVFHRAWKTSLNTKITPQGIWTFIGLDRGDIVEADIEVSTQKGIPLVLRSMHKEKPGNYDAWQYNSIDYVGPTRRIRIVATCRVNGWNMLLHEELKARFHLGIIIIGGAWETV